MVLVVDDDDAQRNVTRVLLQDMDGDFECIEAANGEQALARLELLLRAGREVLVLSDYRMPTMTGLELLQKAQEANDGRPVPGVVFSGVAEYVTETEANDAMVRILDKPYNLEEYEAILRGLLERWQAKATL